MQSGGGYQTKADLFSGQKFGKIVPNVRSLRYGIGKTGVLSIRVS